MALSYSQLEYIITKRNVNFYKTITKNNLYEYIKSFLYKQVDISVTITTEHITHSKR